MENDDIPFNFNCFTSTAGNINIINLTCDYNDNSSGYFKKGMTIGFLIKTTSNKSQFKVNDSDVSYDNENRLIWIIKDLDENLQPSIEIRTNESPANLFPINTLLKLDYSLINANATSSDKNEEVLMNFSSSIESSDLTIKFD